MSTVQLSSLQVEASLNAADYVTGAKQVSDSNDRIVASTGAAGDAVTQAETKVTASMGKIGSILRQTDSDQTKFEQGQTRLKTALDRGIITSDDYAARTQKLAQSFRGSLDDMGNFVAGHEHIAGASSKAREGLVLLHEFIRGDFKRGLGSALIELQNFGALGLLFNPVTLGIAAMAASIGLVVYATASFEDSQNALSDALQKSNNASGATVESLNALALQAAHTTGISVKSATESAAAFAASGQLTETGIGKALSILKDYASFTGKDIPAATDDLIKAMADPEKAAKSLSETIRGSVSPAQLELIKNMQASGDLAGAQAALFDLLSKKTHDLGDSASWLGKIWESVKFGASNAVTLIGRAFSDGDVNDQIKHTTIALEELKAERDAGLSDDPNIDANITGLAKKLGELRAELQAHNDEARKGAQEASLNAIGLQAQALTKSIDPTASKTQELQNQIGLLTKAVQLGGPELDKNRDALERVQHAAEGVLTPTQKLVEQYNIEAEVMAAPIAQRDALRAKLNAELSTRGQLLTQGEADTQQYLAEQGAILKRATASSDLVVKLQAETDQTKNLEGAVGKGANALVLATAANKVDEQVRTSAIDAKYRDVAIEAEVKKALEDRKLATDRAIDSLKFDADQTAKLTDAISQGADAIMRARTENDTDKKIRDNAIDAKQRDVYIEAELKKAINDRRLTSAEALRQEQQTLQADQDALSLAQIKDPYQKEQETARLARLAEIRKLTQEYGGDVDLVNQHLAVWDADEATKRAIKYWDTVEKETQKTADDITKFLVDGLVNAEKGGKSAFKSLWDTALAGGKRLVADIAGEFLKKQFIMPVVAEFIGGGATTIPGAAAASQLGVGPGASSGAGIFNTAGGFSKIGSSLSSAWDWLSGSSGWSLFGDKTASAIDSFGYNNLSFLGFDPGAGTAVGGAGSLSGLLSGAGIGALGGGIAQMTGIAKNDYGSLIGGAAGIGLTLALGSIGGPIGLAIGLLASLFGPNAPKQAGQTDILVDPTTGLLTQGKSAFSHVDGSGATAAGGQAISALNTILKTYGLTATGTGSGGAAVTGGGFISAGSDAGGPQTIQDFVKYLLNGSQFVSGNATSSISLNSTDPVVQAILANTSAKTSGDLNQLTSDLDFAKTYQSLTNVGSAMSAYDTALKQVNDTYSTAIDRAKTLGLDTQKLVDAQQKQIDALNATKAASDFLNANFNNNNFALQAAEWAAQLKQASDGVNSALSSVTTEYNNQASALSSLVSQLDNAANGIGNFLTGLPTSNLSPLSQSQKDTLIAQDYNSTLAAALGGDAGALGNLSSAAQNYLSSQQSALGATSPEYAQLYEKVVSDLSQAQQVAKAQENIAQSQLSTMQASYNALLQIAQGNSDIAVSLDGLPAQLASLMQGALSAISKANGTAANVGQQQFAQFAQLANAVQNYVNTGGDSSQIESLFGPARDSLLAQITDPNILEQIGETYWKGQTNYGPANALRARLVGMGRTPGFATGGSFTAYGPAGNDNLIYSMRLTRGEMVNVSHGDSMSALVAETKALRAEVIQLRRDLASQTAMLAQVQAQGALTITTAVRDGNAGSQAMAATIQRAAANPLAA